MNKQQRNQLITDMYSNGVSGNIIATKLNLNSKTVYRYLKNNNLTKSQTEARMKYTCNDNYFNVIDTEDKAYWLGALYADGNVSKKASKSGQIFLTSKDESWIKDFLNAIESTNTPRAEYHKKYGKSIWKAQITSANMFKDLCIHGCIPNKSLIIRLPKLPVKFIPHFIRGYFDGDGSVGSYKNISTHNWKILKSSICSGSKEFLEDLTQYIPVKNKRITDKHTVYLLQYSLNDTITLYKYMYENAITYLNRKKQIFDNYLNKKEVQRL